jgi:hypothetical protein
MKNLAFLILFQMILLSVYATDDNIYSVSNINSLLLKDASAVKRYEFVKFTIKDPANAIYYYKRAITILNEKGEKHARWTEGYDKYTIIRSVDATLYDAAGKKIRSLKKAEIGDYTGGGEGSLADDNRYKAHNFYYKNYPYTVEYEVEMKRDDIMFMPSWMPVEDEEFTVEKSVFEIIAPTDYKIRYKAFKYEKEPVVTGAKEKTYHWEVNNLIAIKDEYAAPEWRRITPTVVVGATNFEISGFKGDMSNWKDFGKFIYTLKQNRDNLPQQVKTTVHTSLQITSQIHVRK